MMSASSPSPMTDDVDEEEYVCSASSTNSAPAAGNETETKEIQKLLKKENAGIRTCRLIVVILLLTAGGAISWTAYGFLFDEINHNVKENFNLIGNTIQDTSHFRLNNLFEAVRDLSLEITTDAMATDQELPFFTFKLFETYARIARKRSGLEVISFNPRIPYDLKEAWDEYSVKNSWWIEQSLQLTNVLEPKLDTSSWITEETIPYIHEPKNFSDHDPKVDDYAVLGIEPVDRDGVFAPDWQTSPISNTNLINSNAKMVLSSDTVLAADIVKDVTFGIASPFLLYDEDEHNHGDCHGDEHGGGHEDEHEDEHEDGHEEEHEDEHEDGHEDEHGDGHEDEHGDEHGDKHVRPTHSDLYDDHEEGPDEDARPHTVVVQPVFSGLDQHASEVEGYIFGFMSFHWLLGKLLPDGAYAIDVVIVTACNETFTYRLYGPKAHFIGFGDLHEKKYSSSRRVIDFLSNYPDATAATLSPDNCVFELHVYPTDAFVKKFESSLPEMFTVSVAATFLLLAICFLMYDIFVSRRNSKIVKTAARSGAIVSSLFPSNVRDRLFENKANMDGGSGNPTLKNYLAGTGQGLGDEEDDDVILKEKPIADLFLETTIMFADIAGFTAWSSVREPAQVFTLLETIYRAIDVIAKNRRVFKVETIGDCYVAVCGLPEKRKDHAIVMARFARDIMSRMDVLTKRLEVVLGPDTGDLGLRIGLHSGPVTAGVLRGERSRFQVSSLVSSHLCSLTRIQLFGDTMNTAARVESTGIAGRIHISEETEALLSAAGKSSWVTPRSEMVHAKGKGMMQTFWLTYKENEASSTTGTVQSGLDDQHISLNVRKIEQDKGTSLTLQKVTGKASRLVEWNVDNLAHILKQVVARRRAIAKVRGNKQMDANARLLGSNETGTSNAKHLVVDEVREIVSLPSFDEKVVNVQENPESIELPSGVVEQLHKYVASIADLYNNENPFHSFEHASHVTMSVVKLLSRIVAPLENAQSTEHGTSKEESRTLHDRINSDPLTQFACVLSALIHDVDHPGVSNQILVNEKTELAAFYKNQSIAEQNSVDIAWNLLMGSQYAELRGTIFVTEDEKKRFRQLVVNSVMATDIVDKKLKVLRNNRWDRAFAEKCSDQDEDNNTPDDCINRKATIVIENLIQASDVAHTMQHWHIYRKWNERYFMECYQAYKSGRAETDPADGWYQGELGFFDFYIIPLAKKLKDCGVFGISSDEFLNYAQKNRQEWEIRGKEAVAAMVASRSSLENSSAEKVVRYSTDDAVYT